jgi:hypothetical protein
MKLNFEEYLGGVEVLVRGKVVAIVHNTDRQGVNVKAVQDWVRECAHEPTDSIPRLSAECFYLACYEYEYTDTFGGEANYCWVKRGEVWARDKNHALRLAKKALGLNGVRCRFSGIGWVPSGTCTILFVERANV